jgi:hypothetical protein
MTLLDRANLEGPSSELPASTATLRPWLLAWLGLPVLGITNGAIRDLTYKRVAGELAAHQLSTATMLVLRAAYLWALERRWPLQTSRRALTIGGSWRCSPSCSSSGSAATWPATPGRRAARL